jgi:chemotaxis protein histidine kinase CheA
MFRDVKGLSGGTILGDGSVALIVDVSALIPDAGAAA